MQHPQQLQPGPSFRHGKGPDPELFAPANSPKHPLSNSDNLFGGPPIANPSSSLESGHPETTSLSVTNNQSMTSHSQLSLELEHISGFTGKSKSTICAHPTNQDAYISCMGAAVVIGNVKETHKQEILRGHDEEIIALSLSSTGQMLASSQKCSRTRQDIGASIVVWNLLSSELVFELLGFQSPVIAMAFSPDDHFLAASGQDSRLVIWDVRTSELIVSRSFPAPVTILNWGSVGEKWRRPLYSLSFAFSSQLQLGQLVYDISSMHYKLDVTPCHMPMGGITRNYLCASLNPLQTELIAGTIAGELVVFSIDAKTYRTAIPVSRNGVHSVVTCTKTSEIFVGAGDGVIKKLASHGFDLTVVGQVQLIGGVTSLALSKDSSQLFAGTSAGKIYQIKPNTLETSEIGTSHLGAVFGCAFRDDSSEEVATIAVDGSLRVWDLSSYQLKCLATNSVAGLCVVYSKSASASKDATASTTTTTTSSTRQTSPLLITGWADGWVRAYDASTASCKWHISNAHRGEVNCVASSDQFVVSGASDGAVNVWSLVTRELLLQFHEHKRGVTQVLVDVRKRHWIHSCGLDKSLFIYDIKSERRIVAQQLREGAFACISQRLDCETEIITAGFDGRLLFWDCDVADPVQVLVDPTRLKICCVSVSPSGRFVATCGEDCELKVFDLREMRLVCTALGHSETVNCVRWSPDERQLVTVGSDACVCIWNFYVEDESI